MDNLTLFTKLVEAETEGKVEELLREAGYLDDESVWRAIGSDIGIDNNFAAIGNQQSDPSGALVEKIVNGIDAVLMARCYEAGIDPEGPEAPQSMSEAIERFFNVPGGKLGNLTARDRRPLADQVHLVAVGGKQQPNYLVIDRGEGQTPAQFPHTLVSLLRSNKMRIPFVQGKFNSGGTGILQFCGTHNFQLIASRRRPGCPVSSDDPTGDRWGFTIVRRLLPSGGRRSSMYVYLAPNGDVPSFAADEIKVLPGPSRQNHPAPPYAVGLPHGTCIKLYNYRWRAKSIITTEGRYEIEKFLYSPALPFRLTETRDYNANYYSTTVSGGWISATDTSEAGESEKLEEGFPASAALTLESIGRLPYEIAVFKGSTNKRHVPVGVYFVVNGQVHGSLPSNFVTTTLKFSYLSDERGPLLVVVDCTAMNERVREDFFMASRDRVRRNEVYETIRKHLTDNLRNHPGLQAINQRRRQEHLESHLNQESPVGAFQKLIDNDPTLAQLFAGGDHLVTATGPGAAPPFVGRRFPTFFRLSKEPKGGLVKSCPRNRTCRVEFETDAVNDYFSRTNSPGEITIEPSPNLCEHARLWNGRYTAYFAVPWDAEIGDVVQVTIKVTDADRQARGLDFTSTFSIKVEQDAEEEEEPRGGRPRPPRRPKQDSDRRGVALALPRIVDVRRDDWEREGFTEYDALRVKDDGSGGYDCYVNLDNRHLIHELASAKDEEKPQIKHWFKFGLVLAAIGMIQNNRRMAELRAAAEGESSFDGEDEGDDTDQLAAVSNYCTGLAQVIVPIIRSLHQPLLDQTA